MVGRPKLPWGRKEATPGADAPQAVPSGPASSPPRAPPLAREVSPAHHWLSVVVARHGPAGPVPVAGARIVVRPYPRGATSPGDPVGRGTTSAEGSLALLLPPGRYAVAATHDGDSRVVTVRLEHAGRAVLVLESRARRVALRLEVARPDGFALGHAPVEVRTVTGGALVERGETDETGIASLHIPAGAYVVHVGDARVRTYVEADTVLRIAADAAPEARLASGGPTAHPYAQRVRAATQYAAPFDLAAVRDEGWN